MYDKLSIQLICYSMINPARILFVLCLSLLIFYCRKDDSIESVSENPLPVIEETISQPPNPVKDARIEYLESGHIFYFDLQDQVYTMTAKGRIEKQHSDSSNPSYTLKIPEGEYIDYVKYFSFEDDLILIYEVASEESDGGEILRLTGKNLELRWLQSIPGFNLDAGPVEDHFLYVSAIGMVGKFNLNEGNWIWQHNQLFGNNGSFSSFQQPIIHGDSIVFREEDIMKKNIKRFVLNKITGAPL